jgi:hypothetical protein
MTSVEPSLQPRRLKGRTEQRGSRTGFSVWGAMIFGFVFVATGTCIVLMGMRIIRVDPGSVHAPYWVLTMCGVVFACGGLMVWGMAATQHKHERHRRAAALRFGGSPALTDYPWDTRGFTPPRWKRAVQAMVGASILTLFLSIFNWWAWGVADAPWPVKAGVVLFDLILLLVWWQAVVQVGRALKFGGSQLVFEHFPYRMSETISLRWMPPRRMSRADKGSVAFRCVEEYYEVRGTGKNRNKWLVHDELCAETQSFDVPQTFAHGRAVEFRFALPRGARPTCLNSDRPVFWELEVKMAMPGFDFEERYLVPVYEREWA